MKIVSFDIGEKNFAYSIISKKDDDELIIENIVKELADKSFSIIIEQQMRTNIRAQKLAQHLWSYFYIKYGMIDKKFCLKFVPSHLKTQYFLGKNKLDNRMRKKWAVAKVHEILKMSYVEQNKSILTQINSIKKQDDICDTILQSLAFLKI